MQATCQERPSQASPCNSEVDPQLQLAVKKKPATSKDVAGGMSFFRSEEEI